MTYKEYIKSKEWFQIKLDIIQIRGCKCEICGYKTFYTKLQLHHKSYKNLFNENPEDLILLCATCHMKEHGLFKVKVKIKIKKKLSEKRKRLLNEKLKRIDVAYKNGIYNFNSYKRAKEKAINY